MDKLKRGEKLKTIFFMNQKGGTGKSTTAFQVASGLYQRGNLVLCVDLDAQCNLSLSCGVDPLNADYTLFDVFKGNASTDQAIMTAQAGFDCLVGGLSMAAADMTFTGAGREFLLMESLKPYADHYDYCIVDASPHLGIMATNALVAADMVVIPVCADLYSLQALQQVKGHIDRVAKYYNPGLHIAGIVICRYSSRLAAQQAVAEKMEAAAAGLGIRLYKTRIRESTVIRNATNAWTDIFNYDHKSAVAKDYDNFIEELIESEDK